jgi:hypothetical protein
MNRVSIHPGYSLLGPVPSNRACADAEIPIQFCSCAGYETINNPNATIFKLLADLAAYQINVRSHYKPPVDIGALTQAMLDAEATARGVPPAKTISPAVAIKKPMSPPITTTARPTAAPTTPQAAGGPTRHLFGINDVERSKCFNQRIKHIDEVRVMTSPAHKRKDDDPVPGAPETLLDKRKRKEKVEATEVTTDRRFSITFTTENDHNKETEQYEAYFVSNPESQEAAGRLISLRVGSDYDKGLKSFTDEQILPKNVDAIWGACEWRKEVRDVEYRLDWFSPSALAAADGSPKPPTPFYSKTISIPSDVSILHHSILFLLLRSPFHLNLSF